MAMTMEAMEDKVYEEQYEEVKRRFGRRDAERANYGWGVSEGRDSIYIATKVYGHGVLSSTGTYATGEVTHDFEEA